MANNRESKESEKNQTRWIFKDVMVKDLIEPLEASKIEYEAGTEASALKEILSSCIQNCE